MQGTTGWVPRKPDGLSWLSWTRWTKTETSVFKNQKMQWKYTLNIFVVELKLCDLSHFLQPRWNLISGSSIFWEQLYKRFLVFCVRLFYNKIIFVFTRSSQHSTFWMTNRVQASSMQVAQNIGTILCQTTFKALLKPSSTKGKVLQSTAPNQSLNFLGETRVMSKITTTKNWM